MASQRSLVKTATYIACSHAVGSESLDTFKENLEDGIRAGFWSKSPQRKGDLAKSMTALHTHTEILERLAKDALDVEPQILTVLLLSDRAILLE